MPPPTLVVDVKVPILQKRNDVTIFKMMTDFETQPILFIPDIHFSTFQRHVSVAQSSTASPERPAGSAGGLRGAACGLRDLDDSFCCGGLVAAPLHKYASSVNLTC